MGELISPYLLEDHVLSSATVVAPTPKFATIKKVGMTLDGLSQVLLIAAYNNNIDSPLSGFNGEIYLIRGAFSTVLTSVKITVNCMVARRNVNFYAEINGTQKKSGKCTYNGVNYIGVEIGLSSSSNIFISGIYSEDCIFKAVNINDIQWEA